MEVSMREEIASKNKEFATEVKKSCHLIQEVIMYKPASCHPDDQHLFYVLCVLHDGKFATWMYNNEMKGCFFGHYFHSTDLHEACTDFFGRNC